jgi:hypothetical protein
VALSRRKRNFTATERDLLNLARPYLIQRYRNALTHTDLMRTSGTSVGVAPGLSLRSSGVRILCRGWQALSGLVRCLAAARWRSPRETGRTGKDL